MELDPLDLATPIFSTTYVEMLSVSLKTGENGVSVRMKEF